MIWPMRRRPSSLTPILAALAAASAWSAPSQAQAPRAGGEYYATIAVAGFERPMVVRQSGLRRRVDVASGAVVQSFISDRARGSLTVMTVAGRRRLAFVFPLPREEMAAPLPLDGAAIAAVADRMSRVGASTVAGRPCVLQRYTGYLGRNGTACIAADGMVMQLTPDGRRGPLFRVASVTTARQDPKWFTPPPDFQVAALPGSGVALVPLPAGPG